MHPSIHQSIRYPQVSPSLITPSPEMHALRRPALLACTAPHRAAPRRTAPHRTAPRCSSCWWPCRCCQPFTLIPPTLNLSLVPTGAAAVRGERVRPPRCHAGGSAVHDRAPQRVRRQPAPLHAAHDVASRDVAARGVGACGGSPRRERGIYETGEWMVQYSSMLFVALCFCCCQTTKCLQKLQIRRVAPPWKMMQRVGAC